MTEWASSFFGSDSNGEEKKYISDYMLYYIFRKPDNRKASRPLFHCHIAAEKTLRAVTTEKTGNPYPKVHSLA
jgi:hypothetical protein